MPNYRRWYQPGGTYFFTVVTARRAKIFQDEKARLLLRQSIRECHTLWPFEIAAFVLLPDHLHTIWSLPRGASDYSARWGFIKKQFTKGWIAAGGEEQPLSRSALSNRRRGVFQRKFWEHLIRDEDDFERHLDYIHYNPVKHGLVDDPKDWPYSTFHRWVKRGVYEENWGRSSDQAMRFDDLKSTARE